MVMGEESIIADNRRHHILHTLPDLRIGGGQQVLLHNLTHMDNRRFVNHVCYFTPIGDMESQFIDAGVTPLLLYHRYWWLWPLVLIPLVRYIHRYQIDLVHVQGTPHDTFYGQTAALICGVPVVRTLHGMKPSPKRLSQVLRHPRPRILCRYVCEKIQYALGCLLDSWTIHCIVAVSDSVRRSWLPYLHARGIRDEQMTVNHNAIPVETFARPCDDTILNSLRYEVGINNANPVLINVARLTPGKGQQLLVRMMPFILQRYPKAKLLIVGEGEHRTVLTHVIEEGGLDRNITLLGQRSDIALLLAISDVFVFSSCFEGFSLTVLEAMAAGKPVVAIQLPPLRELGIERAGGSLVEQRDPKVLAQSVMAMLDNRDRAQTLGREGQRFIAEHYNIADSVKKLEAVYRSILERSHGTC